MIFADLHMHTNFSDGTFTPEELAALAHERGLGTLALTDHDTMEGCERMAAACGSLGVEFIPAAELTTEWEDIELHLLGYFLDAENPLLRRKLAEFQTVRQDRIREMAERISERGLPLEADAVFAIARCRSPGRPHVARAMVEAGLVKGMDEAFDRFLKKGKPGWVPKFRINAADAIELVHQAGGLAVMAHPGLNRSDRVIPPLIETGLDGIECFHTRHSTHDCERYTVMAEENDLLVTGGSDCHGLNRGQPLIGGIKLPYVYVEKMKERVAGRRADSVAGRP